MGPGSFDPGNPSKLTPEVVVKLLQWGRGLLTPEIGKQPKERPHDQRRFNGAGVF